MLDIGLKDTHSRMIKMPRRGYTYEYHIKKKLIEEHGQFNVVKTAGSQWAPDFIVLAHPQHAVEAKSTIGEKYEPHQKDKEQWKMQKRWSDTTGIPVYYWLLTKRESRIHIEIITQTAYAERYIMKPCTCCSKPTFLNDRRVCSLCNIHCTPGMCRMDKIREQ